MALGITATVTNDTNSPYVSISLTGLTVGVTYTVTRIDNTDEYSTVAVRGIDTISASATTAAGTDYEAPIGRSIKYRVTQNAATADSSNVSLSYVSIGDVWIRSVSTPALSRKVVIGEWPSTDYPTRILSESSVLGRKNPVIITDAWGTRKGTFTIITDNDDGLSATTWQQMVALLTGGGTLMLQTTGRTPSGQEDMYFEVSSYGRTRLGPLRSDGKNVYKHEIGFSEVDRPATAEESLGLRSYANVLDEADTLKLSDTFTRTTSNGVGTADSGGDWTTVGGAASDYSTNGSSCQVAQSTTATLRGITIDVGDTEHDIRVHCSIPVGSAAGAGISQWICGRYVDSSNYYTAQLILTTSGNMTLSLWKRVSGTLSSIGSSGTVTVGTGHVSGDDWTVRLKIDSTSVRAYAWKSSGSEPTDWQVTATDSSLTSGTAVAFMSRRETGNTNSVAQTWDTISVTDSATYQDIKNNYSTYLKLLTTAYPPGG